MSNRTLKMLLHATTVMFQKSYKFKNTVLKDVVLKYFL